MPCSIAYVIETVSDDTVLIVTKLLQARTPGSWYIGWFELVVESVVGYQATDEVVKLAKTPQFANCPIHDELNCDADEARNILDFFSECFPCVLLYFSLGVWLVEIKCS